MTNLGLPPLLLPPPPNYPEASPPLAALPPVHLYLFRNVKDASKTRSCIIKGKAPDGTPAPQCAVIDARMLLDVYQVQLACARSLMFRAQGRLKTRSIYAEILYNMSPWNPITDAMKIWGVRDDSRDFLVVLLDEPDSLSPEEFLASFRKIVDGEERPLEELGQCADVAEICSALKIPTPEDVTIVDREKLLRDVLSTTAIKAL